MSPTPARHPGCNEIISEKGISGLTKANVCGLEFWPKAPVTVRTVRGLI